MIITGAITSGAKTVVPLCTAALLFNLEVEQPPLPFN